MELNILYGIIIILIGYLISFHGFKMRNFLFVIIWFLVGFSISTKVFSNVFEEIEMLHAFGTIIGLICSLLSYKLHLLNIFVSITWICGNVIYTYLNFNNEINTLIALIVGAIVGLLAIKYVKYIIIIATSLIGSHIMLKGISFLPLELDKTLLLAILIFIFIFSLCYQLKDCKNINV